MSAAEFTILVVKADEDHLCGSCVRAVSAAVACTVVLVKSGHGSAQWPTEARVFAGPSHRERAQAWGEGRKAVGVFVEYLDSEAELA